jgi:hypothetical protein
MPGIVPRFKIRPVYRGLFVIIGRTLTVKSIFFYIFAKWRMDMD